MTFVVVNDMYDYHDYNAYGLIAKAISHPIFDYYSHNGPCLLRLYIYIYIYLFIYTIILYNYKIMNDVMNF
jgi:Na+/alanine symporter